MAVKRTELLVLALVLVTRTNCDSDVINQNDMDDIQPDILRERPHNPMDNIQADVLLRGSTVEETRYRDIEPERSIRDFEKLTDNETEVDNFDVKTTTVEDFTTTEPSQVNENLDSSEDEDIKTVDGDEKNPNDAVVAATEQIETDAMENDVVNNKSTVQDVFASENRSINEPKVSFKDFELFIAQSLQIINFGYMLDKVSG